jgi:hypothetical protein
MMRVKRRAREGEEGHTYTQFIPPFFLRLPQASTLELPLTPTITCTKNRWRRSKRRKMQDRDGCDALARASGITTATNMGQYIESIYSETPRRMQGDPPDRALGFSERQDVTYSCTLLLSSSTGSPEWLVHLVDLAYGISLRVITIQAYLFD